LLSRKYVVNFFKISKQKRSKRGRISYKDG
jgi:hypothetical protein